MIILGIDPGTRIIGYGVLEQRDGSLAHITHGVIRTNPKRDHVDNLVEIQDRLKKLIDLHKPRVVGVEQIFFAKNAKTVIGVSEARGVILLTLKNKGVPLVELTPLEIKQAVTGDGSADKKQIQKMVKMILDLREAPTPDDAADALAIAICCANSKLQ